MFNISKKKLIENYEKQINQKNERIKDLVSDNIELKKSNYEIIKENIKISDAYLNKSIEVDKLKEANEILDEMTEELIKEIDLLVDNKIKRLEAIKSRTKKIRVKKKCDSKILEIEKRYL